MAKELLTLEPATIVKGSDILGSTPLHYAASTGDARMAQKLLILDASLAYCDDSFGLFPVHVAAYMGHLRTLFILLENNLDSWELLDQRGRNFLHVGAEGNSSIIFKLFGTAKFRRYRGVIRKASCVRDNEGNTPLHIAARCGRELAVDALLQKEWVDFALTSLDNLALSKSKISTKSYEEIYQHYETLQEVGKAEASPQNWLISYIINKRNSLEDSDTLATKVRTVAFGSVLIVTVTFAAAVNPPGGYKSDGTPVLGRKYIFRAFILADVAAFVSSFYCTLFLVFLGVIKIPGHLLQDQLDWIQHLFTFASTSLGLAFALVLYVVLSPVSKGFSICVFVVALPMLSMQRQWFKNRMPLGIWVLGWIAPFLTVFLLAFIK
ncbi:hypothetical protein LUZ63_001022 [Rhynchospora breviuscula]|uniref:PGG domain-containing protein n=1 Tax=Rhynchospora breviuscula TaxID=2022672 RepID=A0A9Q0CW13_9POAL|nr:hypothetical protein LUZ63_001022 [Rhynchospora breviuscula]